MQGSDFFLQDYNVFEFLYNKSEKKEMKKLELEKQKGSFHHQETKFERLTKNKHFKEDNSELVLKTRKSDEFVNKECGIESFSPYISIENKQKNDFLGNLMF